MPSRPLGRLALLLALFVAACGGDGTGPGGDGGDGGDGGNGGGSGSVPAELVGTWNYGSVSAIGFYDSHTDKWSSGGGIGFSYDITARGTYSYAAYSEIYDGSCTSSISVWIEGTASAQGATLTLRPRSGKTRMTDSCTHKVTDRTPNMSTRTLSYERETSDGATWLTLTDAEGLSFAYQLQE